MKRLLLALTLLLCTTPLFARGKLQGYIEKGGASVTSGGFLSTTKVQQSYPAGTVTAYLAGTLTPATLYSDAAGTAKANPFPADSTGLWFLYAEDGCYDLVFKNGSTVLYTLSDMCITNNGFTIGCSGDITTRLQTAENSCTTGACSITLSSGSCTITDTILIDQPRVNISGAGPLATTINFAPTSGGKPVFQFDSGAAVNYDSSLRNIGISSSDTTYQKIGIRLEDVSKFVLENIAISSQFHGPGLLGAGTSIGLQIRGREMGTVKNVTISTDQPISIESNPNTAQVLDLDLWHFEDIYTLATGANPHWKFESGVHVTNLMVDGSGIGTDNGLSLGTGTGDYVRWIDSAPAPVASSSYVTFQNVRLEGATGGTAYLFNIQKAANTLHQLLFIQCSTGTTNANRGWYLRGAKHVTLLNSRFTGNAAEAFNADSTVDKLRFINTQFIDGSTMTMTGLKQVFAMGRDESTNAQLWGDELWLSTVNGWVDQAARFGVGSGTEYLHPAGPIDTNVSQSGTDAVLTEKDLWSYTLPANTLTRNGKAIRVEAWGTFGANANTKTVRFYFGSGSLVVNSVTTAPNGLAWRVVATIVRTGAAAEMKGQHAVVGSTSQDFQFTTGAAEDTTAAITIKITGQNGTAAANDIVFYGAIVEFIP